MPLKIEGDFLDTLKGGNRLIDSLALEQRAALLPRCEFVTLKPGAILCEAGAPFAYAYFPVSGTISLVSELNGNVAFETESIGREGMLGRALILGINRAPHRGIVRAPCKALRMRPGTLEAALHSHATLARILRYYLYAVFEELSHSRGCMHFHDAGKRLARALLVAQSRAGAGRPLAMTHQMLASSLVVRRGAVTIAAIKLQREGVIRYSRGKITILDHGALEEASCGCYSASLDYHAGLLP
ncbi:MAG: Crp/Fnr family transcriptional regulator [Pseudohongiellaceae bacterium]